MNNRINRGIHVHTFLVICLLSQMNIFAQSENVILEEWVKNTGQQEISQFSRSLTDSNKNVYILGSTININLNYDIIIEKLDSDGTLLWQDIVSGSANGDDYGIDMVVDANDNLIIAGTVLNVSTGYDLVVKKYDSQGSVLWLSLYNGAGNLIDGASTICLGANEDLYVGGSTFGASTLADYLIVKINSAGQILWIQTYDYLNLNEVVTRIAYSASGLIVSGASESSPNQWEMATLKLNPSNGSILSSYRTGGSSEDIDRVTDIKIDGDNFVYVVGAVKNIGTDYDFKIVKLSSDLELIWSKELDGGYGLEDQANAVDVDSDSNVLVTGFITTSQNSKNFFTCKFNFNGVELWNIEFDGVEHGADEAADLVLNNDDEVIITGSSFRTSNIDFYTLKYDGNGQLKWQVGFNSEFNRNDRAMDISIDGDGDYLVVGQSDVTGTRKHYFAVKYSEKTILLPLHEQEIPSSSYYLKNAGQLLTVSSQPANDIKFYNANCSPALYLGDDKFSLQFHKFLSDSTSREHRIDFTFNKNNREQRVYPISPRETFSNFSGQHISNLYIDRLSHYPACISLDIWPNIDLAFTSDQKGSIISYICKSGFSANDLTFDVSGQDGMYLNANGDLVLVNSVEDFILPKPVIYQINANGGKVELDWTPSYSLSANSVSIMIGSFNTNLALIIELQKETQLGTEAQQTENLLWSTFLGGNNSDEANALTSTADYLWVLGTSGSGLFLDATGGIDNVPASSMFVAKFQISNLSLLWVTGLLGGQAVTNPLDIDVNEDNEHVFFVGNTQFSGYINFSNVGLNNTSIVGGTEAFIIELDAFGARNEGTFQSYIGGSNQDFLSAVDFDSNNDNPTLHVVGSTQGIGGPNPSFYPTLDNGGYFDDFTISNVFEGSWQCVITKFDQNFDIEWSTYFGKGSSTLLSDVISDGGKLTVCGQINQDVGIASCTVPSNGGFPVCAGTAADYIQLNHEGDARGHFISEFNNSNLVWSTFVGGTNESNNGFSRSSWPKIVIGQNEGTSITYLLSAEGILNDVIQSPNIGSYNLSGQFDNAPYLVKFVQRQPSWSTYLFGTTYGSGNIDMFRSVNNSPLGVAISGSVRGTNLGGSISNNCTLPMSGQFPICDLSGDYYIENNFSSTPDFRSCLLYFDEFDRLRWSTLYGTNSKNELQDISIRANNIFVAGNAEDNFTLEEFDTNSNDDYYRPNGGAIEGAIAMFELPELSLGISSQSGNYQSKAIRIFPNPVHDELQFTTPESSGLWQLRIYNPIGQVIFSTTVLGSNAQTKIQLPECTAGLYILELSSRNLNKYSSHFVKIN